MKKRLILKSALLAALPVIIAIAIAFLLDALAEKFGGGAACVILIAVIWLCGVFVTYRIIKDE